MERMLIAAAREKCLTDVVNVKFNLSHHRVHFDAVMLWNSVAAVWFVVGPTIVVVRVVCRSVCHMRISLTLSEIDLWLLPNANRNLGFRIQNLPSYS